MSEQATQTIRKFTTEEAQHVVQFVMERGKQRAKAQSTNFCEVDYLCGAMAVFFALESNDKIPVAWIFAPFAGKSLLDADQDGVHLRQAAPKLLQRCEAAKVWLKRIKTEQRSEWRDDIDYWNQMLDEVISEAKGEYS
jgi:hypothetical protein